MLGRWRRSGQLWRIGVRWNSSATERTRNIGIIAHIDAGKTTTTERMLYYSGYTRRIGDVDEGSTVTDFLPAERARGITIQSAAISFPWPPAAMSEPSLRSHIPHNINLIDTPGHADFTFEVWRSLRVLDGAVCILDGVAGVEAQTEKVWAQASAYFIPRLIYINKLDRDGAAFGHTVKEIGARLRVWPAVCGIPWWGPSGKLLGVADVVNLQALRYPESGDGKEYQTFDQNAINDSSLIEELKTARLALMELLAEHDDEMASLYLDFLEDDKNPLNIPASEIWESLRRCTLQNPQVVAPVFAGASFRNVGVQPLLNAVVDLLPSPAERPSPEVTLGQESQTDLVTLLSGKAISKHKKPLSLALISACALAFKLVQDARRGIWVYVRVYSGTLARNTLLFNTALRGSERAQRLLKVFANDAVDVDSIPSGQIGVIPGLKFARTGDTLLSYSGSKPTGAVETLQLRPINIPPPVFFVSIEPNSLSDEKSVREALGLLLREDPSLHVTTDEESGQILLSGMGELHLEIARDRLSEFKVRAHVGSVEIGYREAITQSSGWVEASYNRSAAAIFCSASVEPYDPSAGAEQLPDRNGAIITLSTPEGTPEPTEESAEQFQEFLRNGVLAALSHSPIHGYPLHSTLVRISLDTMKLPSSPPPPPSIAAAARLATHAAMRASSETAVLMEPVMDVVVSTDEASLGPVTHDLTAARGAVILSLDADAAERPFTSQTSNEVAVENIYAPPDPFAGGGYDTNGVVCGTAMKQIQARVPLKEMVGYLKHLRSLTKGRGTFTMEFDRFERMDSRRQKSVLGGA
ncbi:P-loop containing nucleoside triphosphate hydrolase protein [Piedraia hortae CBS 480.64]|uniref:Ribosome-releasing factor 2, mitochondrial n=1 Tax=Piedraia hortae CBS 480.64 TaxID=1314780 RepID=A0A6A7C455_9PEZI|nr:P-loop containing nucleoside triphosphate hydrolase protein [Piedraia hortae CBS 480.64]